MLEKRTAGPCGAGRRVLVVEDNPDGRASLCLLLRILGHHVEAAADGPEGVRLALEMRPEVALIDIGLPGFSGYEVCRRVRAALGRSVALVACTAYDDAEACRLVDEAGFDGHAVKPVALEDLAEWLGPEARGTSASPSTHASGRSRRCPPA